MSFGRFTSTISPYCEKTASTSPSVSENGRPPAYTYAECLYWSCHDAFSLVPSRTSWRDIRCVFRTWVKAFMMFAPASPNLSPLSPSGLAIKQLVNWRWKLKGVGTTSMLSVLSGGTKERERVNKDKE